MNRLYIFYPHCYIKATSNELLIYDTIECRSVYMKNVVLPSHSIVKLDRFGYIEENSYTMLVLQEIENNNFGYYIQYDELMPYIPERKLRITTSLHKEKEALGYNLTSYTNMMLRSLTILLNNTIDSYLNTFSYKQLEYPDINYIEIDLEKIFVQLSSFCLEKIILSGELPYGKLEKFLEFANNRNIQVIYRIHYLAYSCYYIQEILHKFDSLVIELLVDSLTPFHMLNFNEERLIYKYIITSISDVDKISKIRKDVILYPVFLDTRTIILQSQMIMTKDEILQSHQTLKECYIKEYINPSCFGHLTINFDGEVYCLNEKIESLRNMDLPYIVNKWVGSQDCLWYYTRNKRCCCKDCAIQVLCPSVSIYELLNIYKCPCTV